MTLEDDMYMYIGSERARSGGLMINLEDPLAVARAALAGAQHYWLPLHEKNPVANILRRILFRRSLHNFVALGNYT